MVTARLVSSPFSLSGVVEQSNLPMPFLRISTKSVAAFTHDRTASYLHGSPFPSCHSRVLV